MARRYAERGGEMGRFLLGSTVVMLWPAGVINFNKAGNLLR